MQREWTMRDSPEISVRDPQWTEAIAIGEISFLENIGKQLDTKAVH